ncbi:MAG: hypothetical protein FJ149_10325 [Euryarchaeota archaeon]|nr:hypothetical protein [Euryarchaeota archaeon]
MIRAAGGTGQGICRPAPAVPFILCLLLLVPPAAAGAGPAGAGEVAVLFFYGPAEYYWGNATASAGADAIDVSKAAAGNINRGFVYEDATGAVEIGGLRPGPNDTWRWSLLSWDAAGERWTPGAGNPRGLAPQAGGAIAWGPNHTRNPTPNPLSRYPWPMDRCTASRGGETLSPPPLTNLTHWRASLGIAVRTSPVVAGGRVFVLGDGGPGEPDALFCLDEMTGARLWSRELGVPQGPGIGYGAPAYADGRVLVGTSDGKLRALGARDGTVEWTFNAAGPGFGTVSSPAVAAGKVLFSTGEGRVVCLDPDGREVWASAVSGPAAPFPGAPAVLGDRVVAGTQEGRLVCLDLGNGSVIWNLSLSGGIVTTPALSTEGYAFVLASAGAHAPSASMTLYSFYMVDAVQQWNATYPRSLSSPASSAGGLFLGTGTEIVGHHPDRGTRFWGVPVGEVDASPAVARGFIYFATNTPAGLIGCVRAGGYLDWTLAAGEPVLASPAVADGRLFVATVNGTVLCLGRPPEPRVAANLSAPARATEGDLVKVTAALLNSGEAPALFTVYLTVDGNRTGATKGPFELGPGEAMDVSLEWRARRGKHTVGLEFNGTDGTFGPASVDVGKPAGACSSVIWTSALASSALAVPSIVRWKGRKGR